MASKRVTCGEASGWNRCRKPADHDGECAKPPTARERRLMRLLERAQDFVDYVAGPASRKLSATIDRELGKGEKRAR